MRSSSTSTLAIAIAVCLGLTATANVLSHRAAAASQPAVVASGAKSLALSLAMGVSPTKASSVVAAVAATSPVATACASDALQAKQLAYLQNFAGWLAAANAKGYVGEVGWPAGPDAVAWNALANTWYSAADADGLWVTAWSTGDWWGTYTLQPYMVGVASPSVDERAPQAAVLAAHLSTSTVLRGVNTSGGEFGVSSAFSDANPGVLGTDYEYPSSATFEYLATQGVKIVRLPFRWERLQPKLYSPLNSAAVTALTAAVSRANQAGLKVILDMHNYGSYITPTATYPLGTRGLSTAAFVDFWTHFSTDFANVPGVAGYDLMNEPHNLPSVNVWQQASQQALTAIRATGDKTLILVEGYDWAGAYNWSAVQPKPWITDPAANFRYEAHQYFDLDSSGRYADSYATDLSAAQNEGFRASC